MSTKVDTEVLGSVRRSLESDRIELIDFDVLQDLLADLEDILKSHEKLSNELRFLKEEYGKRIVGMLKANLACRADADDVEKAARLSGDLSGVEARELVKLYSRTAARFRANFPSSFRYLGSPGNVNSGNRWLDHKI